MFLQSSSTQPVYHRWKLRYNHAATLRTESRNASRADSARFQAINSLTSEQQTCQQQQPSTRRSTTTWTRRLYLQFLSTAGPQRLASVSAAGWVVNNGVVLRCSLPALKFISKAAEKVAKKPKKTEKEEKEFRKKFKVCLTLYHKSSL